MDDQQSTSGPQNNTRIANPGNRPWFFRLPRRRLWGSSRNQHDRPEPTALRSLCSTGCGHQKFCLPSTWAKQRTQHGFKSSKIFSFQNFIYLHISSSTFLSKTTSSDFENFDPNLPSINHLSSSWVSPTAWQPCSASPCSLRQEMVRPSSLGPMKTA